MYMNIDKSGWKSENNRSNPLLFKSDIFLVLTFAWKILRIQILAVVKYELEFKRKELF